MREKIFTPEELRELVKFTDPLYLSIEREEEILDNHKNGILHPPFFIEDKGIYLIFNGNHRVLVAINNSLNIKCKIIENLEDIEIAQISEGEKYRDISMVKPLNLENLLKELRHSANKWAKQDVEKFIFE